MSEEKLEMKNSEADILDIHIKGIMKTSLIDYPGKICSVVFLSKCNFRCKFCHNPELILNEQDFPNITTKEFFEFLKNKKKWIDGVCITGGEPTMHKGLIEFIKSIKNMGLSVKLDTNGSNPKILKEAIDAGIDYVAMDIKNSPEKYDITTSSKINIDNIRESIKIIIDASEKKGSSLQYEFRTTVIPRYHCESDFEEMSKWLKGAKNYFIQPFKSQDALLDMELRNDKSHTHEELHKFKEIMEKNIGHVEIR
jgi:pyruvate formate lyase activating enzyme